MQVPATVALIMAGGRGERFWPKSRQSLPKQFLNIVGQKSMLQQTVERINPLIPTERVFISTGADYFNLVRQQLPDLPPENIIVEPVGRDTAPCIGLATLFVEKRFPDSVMAVLPADHLILDTQKFLGCLRAAADFARRGDNIVTLGIKPDRPETGYGYIHVGSPEIIGESYSIHRVNAFKEKPDRAVAEAYMSTGEYLWNSGMFVWRLDTIKGLIKEHLPEVHNILGNIKEALDSNELNLVLEKEFCRMPKISVDYGIMEKADRVYVIPGDFGWDDVGGWLALSRVTGADECGNIVSCTHVGIDTKNCIIDSNGKLVVTIGLEDVVVVNTDDVVFVCHKDKVGDLKQVINHMKDNNLTSYL